MNRIAFLSVVLASLFVRPAAAEIRGDLGLLEKVARGIQSNYEKIVTWEGTALATDFRDGRAANEFRVEFAYDATQKYFRTNVESVRQGERRFCSRMLRGDERFSVGPFAVRDANDQQQPWVASVVADPKGEVVKLHPIRYVNCVTDVPSFLLMFVENAERFHRLDRLIEISQQGPRVVLELSGGSNRYEFDERIGYNLVRFVAQYPGVRDEWQLEFRAESPHTPLGWTKRHVEYDKESYRQEFKVREDQVNGHLSREAFSLRSMGLRTGDALNDTIRNVMVPLQMEPTVVAANDGAFPWRWLALTATLGIAVTLATRRQASSNR